MQQYYIRFNRTGPLILAIVVPCMLIVPLFIIIALKTPGLSEGAHMSIIFSLVAIDAIFTVFIARKLSPKALLTLKDDGFIVEFPNIDRFTPASFEVKASDIVKFRAGENEGNYYLSLTTSVAPSKFNISAASTNAEDKATFDELILAIATMVSKHEKSKLNS